MAKLLYIQTSQRGDRSASPGVAEQRGRSPELRPRCCYDSHETCTAKMGRDSISVVDGYLKVYGVDNLRIADGSIMPRVTTGNTMAPCVIIGERAAEILRTEHKLHISMVDEGGKSAVPRLARLTRPPILRG